MCDACAPYEEEEKEEWWADELEDQFGEKFVEEVKSLIPGKAKEKKLRADSGGEGDWGWEVEINGTSVTLSGAEQFGCCGIAVISGVHALDDINGLAVLRIIEETAKYEGYTLLVATDVVDNKSRKVFMNPKSGWRETDQFVNNRTSNTVAVYSKDIRNSIPRITPTPRKRQRAAKSK